MRTGCQALEAGSCPKFMCRTASLHVCVPTLVQLVSIAAQANLRHVLWDV